MGLNTIETYVAWNAHSSVRGRFDTSGGLDLGRFLDFVADAGLHAIVRPGPYICAEWDDGRAAWLAAGPAGCRPAPQRADLPGSHRRGRTSHHEVLGVPRRYLPVLARAGCDTGWPAPVMSVAMTDRLQIWDALPHLGAAVRSDRLPTFDDLGLHRGFALYSTEVESGGLLHLAEARDRAQVFHDRVGVGVLEREPRHGYPDPAR